jgi:hypothetical protein
MIRQVEITASDSPTRAVLMLLGFVAIASAFMNNTPIVVVMIPVFVQIARIAWAVAPSKLLIPLSYAAIMGGTLTLIGTSTNLLVDGWRAQGLEPFTIFEITPSVSSWWPGACSTCAVHRAAPAARTDLMAAMLAGGPRQDEVLHRGGRARRLALIGQKVNEVELFKREGVRLIDVLRGDASLRRNMSGVDA